MDRSRLWTSATALALGTALLVPGAATAAKRPAPKGTVVVKQKTKLKPAAVVESVSGTVAAAGDRILVPTAAGLTVVRDGEAPRVVPGTAECRLNAATVGTALLTCGGLVDYRTQFPVLLDLATDAMTPLALPEPMVREVIPSGVTPPPGAVWLDASASQMGTQWLSGLSCGDKCFPYVLNWHTGEYRSRHSVPDLPKGKPFSLDTPTGAPTGKEPTLKILGVGRTRYTRGAFARTLRGAVWGEIASTGAIVQGWKLVWSPRSPTAPAVLRVADVRRDRVLEIPLSRFGTGAMTSMVSTPTRLAVTLTPDGGHAGRTVIVPWPATSR